MGRTSPPIVSATGTGHSDGLAALKLGNSGLFLVPDGKDRHGLGFDAIAGDIAAVAKVDKPFPKLFRQIVEHPAEPRVCAEDRHTLPDSVTCPPCGVRAPGAEEVPQALQIPHSGRGEDHSWHSGAGRSSSVPQFASH